MMKTTLNALRKHGPCKTSWSKLLAHLGKTSADNEDIDLQIVLKVLGVADTVWSFRVFPGLTLQYLALDIAQTVSNLDTSGSAQRAIDAGRSYLAGTAHAYTVYDAAEAAVDAAATAWVARADARAARAADAAYSAARAAARVDAYDAAARAAYAAYAAVSAADDDSVLLDEQHKIVARFIKENS